MGKKGLSNYQAAEQHSSSDEMTRNIHGQHFKYKQENTVPRYDNCFVTAFAWYFNINVSFLSVSLTSGTGCHLL